MSANPPRLAALTALTVALALATASSAPVSVSAPRARIDAVDGKVDVSPAGMKVWIAVSTPPYTLKDGDRVRTGEESAASVVFPDNSRVKLDAGTLFAVERIRKGDAAMRLDAGDLHAWVTKALSRHFRVTTPAAVAQARGTEFSVGVTATQDTQVEVQDGVVAVKIKSGEETELGGERPFRSLLVIPGRPMALLPHPHEEAGGTKSPRRMADCLHLPNGALRGSVEDIEACQARAHDKRAKAGALSAADERLVREHEVAEIKRFLTTTGALSESDEDPAQAADGAEQPAERNVGAETSALMNELGLPENSGDSPLASMSPDKIKLLQQSLANQHANPEIQAAFNQAANGKGQMTNDQLQALLQGLKLEQSKLPARKNAAPPAGSDAP